MTTMIPIFALCGERKGKVATDGAGTVPSISVLISRKEPESAAWRLPSMGRVGSRGTASVRTRPDPPSAGGRQRRALDAG